MLKRAIGHSDHPSMPGRRLRGLGGLIAVIAAFAGFTGVAPRAEALPDPASAERTFLTMLNDTRAGSGLAPLMPDPAASSVARNWSTTMAAQNRLYHNPDLAAHVTTFVTRDWLRAGENVGVGGDVEGLHRAFWNSLPHRANMLGDYNRVGVGVVNTDRLWVTFTFVKAPGLPALPACRAAGYMLDAFGALHPVGGAPRLATSGYWRGWDIARDVSLTADGTRGYVLDGFGGLHPVGGAARITSRSYWRGWDIARGVALTKDGRRAFVLDAYGGIHSAGSAPVVKPTGYWRGWQIARDIQVDPVHGSRGYVLDGFGALHPFGGMPRPRLSAYIGFDAARSFVFLPDATGGYIVDAFGGVHPFAVGSNPMPRTLTPTGKVTGPYATGLLLGDQSAVVVDNGAELGAGEACAAAPRWGNWSILRAAVSR